MSESTPLVSADHLFYEVLGKSLLADISFSLAPGSWLAVLGENGAGKTTLLDLLMGFKKPSRGTVNVFSHPPFSDRATDRQKIGYLSEKVDIPGDWSVGEFLSFNSHFYPGYDFALEAELSRVFRVSRESRVGNLSAGEIRRAQIVAALSFRPALILIDEITAVLDIVGRRKLLKVLNELRHDGTSIIFATNILEGLHGNLTDILLLQAGKLKAPNEIRLALTSSSEAQFFDQVADALESP